MKSPFIKRWVDIAGSLLGLLLLWPLMLLIGLLVYWRLGSPVLFAQLRPGLKGRPFTMYKFRTMRNAVDAKGTPLPDETRITLLGRILRSSSLDELPELINVLKGDMSLVGPRPLLMSYLERYTPDQFRRHDIKPGITGWAQINGRNTLDWEDKFKLDLWYVDNWNIVLDIRILALTLKKALAREGINHSGHASMPEFKGTKNAE